MARSPSSRDADYPPRDRHYGRGHDRRRSRSRDRDRRHDDRDRDNYRRRDRSRGRYDDQRGSRRDRSRDKKRSRDNSPVRDRRDRDRFRDDRDYHDDRDRKRFRRDGDSPKRSRRDDSRSRRDGRLSPKEVEISRPSTADAEEEAKKAKLAKVEAWKKKVEAKKREAALASGSASPQVKLGSNAASPPAVLSQPTTGPGSPAATSAAPKTAKFDPKEITRRAAAALERHKAALGSDVVIPKSSNQASNVNSSRLADNSKVAPGSLANGTAQSTQVGAKITGLGLKKTSVDKHSGKGAAALDEDVEVERKLEKLPDMPTPTASGDAALANDSDPQDEGDAIRSDEEEAEKVHEAALKRAEEVKTESQDVVMAEAGESVVKSEANIKEEDVDMKDEDEEEVDALDAFMNGLEQPNFPNRASGKGKKTQPQVFNSDDEGDLDAVGDDADDFLAMAAKRKKKDIPKVDHSKMKYDDFRKNFYNESVELSEMTAEDVEAVRADLDNIKCRGVDVPKPIMKWSQGGFGAQILDVIRDLKFEKPTSIQSQALPAIMSGRDVIGVAKTGSGKTMAFILPMFRHIKDQRPVENQEGPIGLILAPTRELAVQIFRDCKPYIRAMNLRAVCAYGGAPIKDQIAELKRGAEIIVCTPGRLIDLLAANSGRVTNLKRVTYVVLDEADRMFDMGFEPQITKVLNNIRPQRQLVLFSATFPRSMEALARKSLTKPIEIVVGGRSVVAPEITQIVEVRSESTKFRRLLELLGELHSNDEDARSLIFVERQETADNMLKELLFKQYPSVSIHGGREQIDRDQAINDFKAGVYPVMVATSVAARGLDVKQLKLVVNYDSPNHIEDYVHRTGRTGRAGNTGTAVTFVTREQDRFAPFLIKALTDSKQEIPLDLEGLKASHDEKVKSGEAKKIGSGFGGRGIERLDAARDAERAREKKQYKTGDEPEEEEEEGEKKTDKKESAVDKLVAKAAGSVQDRDSGGTGGGADASIIPSALNDALNNAMKVQKAEKPAPSDQKGGRKGREDPLAKVSAVAATIGNRLGRPGGARPGVPVDNRGPDAGAFHATLEINDFPQKARWGVTNRTNVAKILEATGVSITSKGVFYAKGVEPQPGEPPKLYILVEGDTEVQVENAMRELTRLLKEGTIAALDAEARSGTSGGRYSVV